MPSQKPRWYIEFLDADEQPLLEFESTRVVGGKEVAAAGAFGVVGVIAVRTMSTSVHQKRAGEWIGPVVLTGRRLLMIDGHGIVHAVDRSTIESLRLSRSAAGAWMSRVTVVAAGITYKLHTRAKQAGQLAHLAANDGLARVDANETDTAGLLKAVPVILLFMAGGIALLGAAGPATWVTGLIGLTIIAAAEVLRRLLFPKDPPQKVARAFSGSPEQPA